MNKEVRIRMGKGYNQSERVGYIGSSAGISIYYPHNDVKAKSSIATLN